jgi:Single domain von Willebrand factor type C
VATDRKSIFTMNFRLLMALAAFVCPLLVSAYSPEVVYNTRAKNEHGKDVCSWDNVQILPGETIDVPGKCRELFCRADFSIKISSCSVDPSGKCQWLGPDNSKPFDDCCGIRLCS